LRWQKERAEATADHFAHPEQNESFIYYSNYTEAQLLVPSGFLLESIVAADFDQKFVYKKYANKSEFSPLSQLWRTSSLTSSSPSRAEFLKASIFARNWARQNAAENVA
jgi:G2/mitotic-specific cyclin 2